MKRITALIILFLLIFTGCGKVENAHISLEDINTYTDIPGVTPEEISAIETLKQEKASFSYGHILETETFFLPDGTYAGFTVKVCALLSDLFGTQFRPAYCDGWDTLKQGIDNRTIDFAGAFTPTAERLEAYHMTLPVAVRNLRIYTLKGSDKIVWESDVNGLRLGFIQGSVTAETITEHYPGLSFEIVAVTNSAHAAELLKSGEIDAFVGEGAAEPNFEVYEFIESKEFFKLAYSPVSITTANPDFEPIISVINKYLDAGGADKINELYNEGAYEYTKHKLYQTFTDEEKAYLDNLVSRNQTVRIALENTNYPFSFYNADEKEFEGIAVDVLAQISRLTGIRFENTTTSDTLFSESVENLKTGNVSIISHLIYSDERAEYCIWSTVPYSLDNYVLISKLDFPPVESYQIPNFKTGVYKGSVYEYMYGEWFPTGDNLVLYDTVNEAFDALEKGDIDFVMGADYTLLAQTNFREKSGFIVNYRFDTSIESLFGFNKNDEILQSIVDKAQEYIEIEPFSNYWKNRLFDYNRKMSEMQTAYLSIFSGAMLLVLIVVIILFIKNKKLSKTLSERTSTLSAVYSSIPDTLFTKSTEGVYTSCNPGFEKQAGKPEAEIIGKTYAEVFKDRVFETVDLYKEIDNRVLSERTTETVEEMVSFADGSHRFLETLKAPLIQNGNVVGLLGTGRDVTERKKMEDELQQAFASVQTTLAMFEYIINTAQIAFAMSMDNIITQANEYSKSYIGMNVGDDIRSFYTDPSHRDEIIKTLEHDYMIPNIIIRYNMQNGESHRFLSSIASFQYEQSKTFIVWAIDIEDDERRNDQLRVTQESLQSVLDTLPVPIRIFDMETTKMVYVNDSLLELLEYDSADELCGLKMRDILADVQSDGTTAHERENIVRDSVSADPASFELEYRTKTGKIIEALVVTRLIDYKGRPSSIGIIKDLTAEKERAQFLLNAAEREKEANQSKSRFLANMSHEIRTPMNAIIGMSELLLNEQLTDRQQGYVNDINVSSHSLLSIINDILDLSKIESGKLELTPVDYDFNIFLDNIRSMFEFVARKKGIEFILETEGEMPKCLFGDDVRLRQVLTNICGNAVKFTNEGFIRLKVTAADETLVFEILDTGMGIRSEALSKLFEAFVQADTYKNRNIKGTGLGLSISKAFVEMMDGTITVASEYGQGTVFTVTIPKVAGDESAVKYEEKGGKAKSFFAPSAKILVVDDNELNLKVASGLLNMYKINVDTISSGMEAIGLIKGTDYDIVFMDHMMPEMDGVETTKEIRKLGGKYKQLTIIALTANAIRGAREMFLANEFNDFITKPIDVDELAEMLREWLPPEKIELRDETAEAAVQENESTDDEPRLDFLSAVKKVSGINTEIGLSRLSGMEEMYRETLELFCKKLLTECEKMEGFLSGKDLHNLAVSVHGMKSSLATIGAIELSETAFVLETASKNEELTYCEEHFPEFLENLRSLHTRLSEVFPDEKTTVPRPEGDTSYLRENVKAALEAADDFDANLVSEAISKLLAYDFGAETNDLLESADSAIRDFDFDAAAAFLDKIINP